MTLIDWSIVGGLFIFLVAIALYSGRYTKGVADFLAANRCAGRYVLSLAEGVQGLGAISVVAMWQAHYENGFTGAWWSMMYMPVTMLIAITGYIIYRYRQARVMTMGQLFEIRYSKNFRIFAGIVAFVSGTVNFAIFPFVGAKFFIYFCGLPQAFMIGGITIGTFPAVMVILLGSSLFFVWIGGQITVVITDFFQGIFCNTTFIIIAGVAFLYMGMNWGQIGEAFEMAPVGKSPVQPFEGGGFENFSFWYYIIGAIGMIYGYLGWQGTQGVQCSAKTPHEAKMAKVLGAWRGFAGMLVVILLPIFAYTLMNHPAYSSFAGSVNETLDGIGNEALRKQMTVPVAMANFLPIGIKGALAAVMLAAFISTHDTYLHSWGSIFIQDVVMPFRKKPFGVRQHMWLLRFSILGVAIIIFFFSLWYEPTQAILMFFALTGTIFLGGSGAVIIGGLYWKRGTTSGAWGAMIVGITLAVGGFVLRKAWPNWYGVEFPISGQWIWAVAMVASSIVYITLSLIEGKVFNIPRMLHKGKYAVEQDVVDVDKESISGKSRKEYNPILQRLGFSHEFTTGDKVIFWSTIAWSVLWFAIFVVGTTYNFVVRAATGQWVSNASWLEYWKVYTWATFGIAIFTTIWFTIGGIENIFRMFRDLKITKRDARDDGMVVDHHSLGDNLPKNDETEGF